MTSATVNNGTITDRMDRLLSDAYAAAGIDPSLVVVTQGSYTGNVSASGSTHDGGGAADLRVWNLPAAPLYDALVVELRRRNGCAWYRDEAHGGFDPHIHVIVRDEPGLSSGARSQVTSYDNGRNGLSDNGPDYHPRPAQYPMEHYEGDDMPLSTDDVEKVAAAVWNKVLTEPNGTNDHPTAATLLQRVRRDTGGTLTSQATTTLAQTWGKGSIQTGWQPDGTYDAEKPIVHPPAWYLSDIRGMVVQMFSGSSATVGKARLNVSDLLLLILTGVLGLVLLAIVIGIVTIRVREPNADLTGATHAVSALLGLLLGALLGLAARRYGARRDERS